METLEFARHFIKAIEAGELETVRGCYAEDAQIWHNFDDLHQSVDENLKVLAWMMRKAPTRTYEIKRLEEIEGGFLQQHVLRMVDRDGKELAMPACVIVRLEHGKIKRLEEYLDPTPTRAL